jgi:protoporphyrinogen oxidase
MQMHLKDSDKLLDSSTGCSDSSDQSNKTRAIVLGGGLAGLSAAHVLSKAGLYPVVIEADSTVGGLSKTIVCGNYRFDLGGHRFFTKDKELEAFVLELMGDELLNVGRKSQIFMNGKFFDYPLKPLNSLSGLGLATVAKIIIDYAIERVKGVFKPDPGDTLEDWVVRNFGRKMFDIYFKVYSEKVWGIPCNRISRSWVEKRIAGLSLTTALKNAFFGTFGGTFGKDLPTLTDNFLYPRLGIGRLSDRLEEEINLNGCVLTSSPVKEVLHNGTHILKVSTGVNNAQSIGSAQAYISTMPVTALVKMMNPLPPKEVIDAANALNYRDLVIAAVVVDRPEVTHQSWVYVPDRDIAFGRIHEPKVWSRAMAPEGSSLLVLEYFSTRGDSLWNSSDEDIMETSKAGLKMLGFVEPEEVIDGWVLRIPGAYPLFEVGYEKHSELIMDYLSGFENLQVAGRSGSFSYQNMDHAMASGFEAAHAALGVKV